MFNIKLDPNESIHDQICGEISRLISLGILGPDEKLPAVRETAKELGVSPNTVQKAYASLEKSGLIYSLSAKGSYVSSGGKAAEAVKNEAAGALRSAVQKAAETGVDRETVEKIVNEIYGKKGRNL